MATELKANQRNTTKRSYITQLRQKGNVPAVVYGSGTEPQSVAVTETEFIKVLKDQGLNGVISLIPMVKNSPLWFRRFSGTI